MLPSFPSIRERNLRTLYGDGGGVDDKSPKGSVDAKIRPLVDLINRHPDFVTLSSCSGRVALFDPTAGTMDTTGANDDAENATNQYPNIDAAIDHMDIHDNDDDDDDDDDRVTSEELNNGRATDRSTNISGKGHGGKWIFVTHDILPDLGLQIIHSLKRAGRERLRPTANLAAAATLETSTPSMLIMTFKHEPPLLHVAASNLESGMRLLRAIKSAPHCAMRESGLVVTDKRVTVEIRTTSTMLALPIVIRRPSPSLALHDNEKKEASMDDVILAPDEEYLMSLSEVANERMLHNEALLDGLFSVIQRELFGHNHEAVKETKDCDKYSVTLQSTLPPLNLWKTAAVVLPINNTLGKIDAEEAIIDLDVLAFGGQGVGPNMVSNIDDDTEHCSTQASKTCVRWNAIFRLRRQGGVWSKQWEIMSSFCKKHNFSSNFDETTTDLVHTSAGMFRLTSSKEGMGCREGHTACVVPRFAQYMCSDEETPPDAVIIFGGRTSSRGQGMSPTNDLFFYVNYPWFQPSLSKGDTAPSNTRQTSTKGLFGRPFDVRGSPPEPRYGHTMSLLPNNTFVWKDATPFAVVAGGTGISSGVESSGQSSYICLSSIYTLTCIVEVEHHDTKCPPCSHLMWNRIADMPSPRSFHTSFIDRNYMFVFGGYAEADDPFSFSPELSSWFTVPLDLRKESTSVAEYSENNNTFASVSDELPLRIGSSATLLALKTNMVALIVGGARSRSTALHCRNHNDDEGFDPPIILLVPNNQQHDYDCGLAGRKELVRARFQFEPVTEDDIDLGSCVHHCVVALPQSHNDSEAVTTDDTASAIVVGGGVPCFSFGQSYARSCVINVMRANSNNSNITATATPSLASARHHSNRIISTDLNSSSSTKEPQTYKTRNGIQNQQRVALNEQANVIYVKSCHAKAVKNELEQRGLLDKRYKMIPVLSNAEIIAIPIIISIDGSSNTYNYGGGGGGDEGDDNEGKVVILPMPFSQWVIRFGTEKVPYSSSYLGTMKNKSANKLSGFCELR